VRTGLRPACGYAAGRPAYPRRMGALLPFLVVTACLAVPMAFLALLAVHVRRRGTAGAAVAAALAAYDEALHETAYETHCELQAQKDFQLPVTSPGDPWRPRRRAARGLRTDG
jgi:hypothetical protein